MPCPNNVILKLFFHRLILVPELASAIPAFYANLPGLSELMQLLDIDQQKLADLEQGKIVSFESFEVAEGKENELAAGVALYLPASPPRIIRLINQQGLAAIDTDVMAQGTIPAQAALDTFQGFGFQAGSEEARAFLKAEPGKALRQS